MNNIDEYQKVVSALKRRKKGATAADVCAATALPLSSVRELLPKAADEFSGHLQVTQSGEILYHFPFGFSSRYRGWKAGIKKTFFFFKKGLKTALVFLFKIWIMTMLIGYFIAFLAIALASVVLSMVIQSKSSNDGRSSSFAMPNLFGLIWRIWFIQEVTKPRYGSRAVFKDKKKGKPLHKAIFSFIFGEEDPNKDWIERENKAVIAYVQANRGVISLAEYMAFSGENSIDAEKSILSFCSNFGGSPEVTEEGTIVYRFDELLLKADQKTLKELLPPIKRTKIFSENKKSMNTWFIVINAVNLIFGSYYFYNSLTTGFLTSEIQYQSASYLYAFTHILLEIFTQNPVMFISIVLGLIPLAFSLFFWLIPVFRYLNEKKENEEIKLSNFKRIAFNKIWSSPKNINPEILVNFLPEAMPKNTSSACDRVIKDLNVISKAEIEQNEDEKTIYSFNELEDEKVAIEKYRKGINQKESELGSVVFDSKD